MNQPFLITTDELKEFGFMDGNVQDELIAPTLRRVQDHLLIGLIGSSLFNYLLNAVNNDSLNANDEILLNDYIKQVLISGVDLKIINPLTYQTKNSGIQYQTNQAVITPSKLDKQELIDEYQQYYDTYAQRLINYLRDNKALYPSYDIEECTWSAIEPAKEQNTLGIRFL